jgi:hypothetical protein
MIDLRKPPLDQKYVQSLAAHKLARDLMAITESTVHSVKITDEGSQLSSSQEDLNLDSWPWGHRIRESF